MYINSKLYNSIYYSYQIWKPTCTENHSSCKIFTKQREYIILNYQFTKNNTFKYLNKNSKFKFKSNELNKKQILF